MERNGTEQEQIKRDRVRKTLYQVRTGQTLLLLSSDTTLKQDINERVERKPRSFRTGLDIAYK